MMQWIDNRARPWGGRRNLLRVELARTWHRLGGYRDLRKVDWGRVQRLVFVCKGNICRSPYAEWRARALGLEAISCGLRAQSGRRPEPPAIEAAYQRGLDLDSARATSIRELTCEAGDLLLFMEPRQRQDTLAHYPALAGSQLSLLGLWRSPATPLIPDPYGRGSVEFHHCFGLIDSAVEVLRQRLAEATRSSPIQD